MSSWSWSPYFSLCFTQAPRPLHRREQIFLFNPKKQRRSAAPLPPLLYTVTGAHLHHHQLYPWQLCQLSHKLIDWKAWHENVHALPFWRISFKLEICTGILGPSIWLYICATSYISSEEVIEPNGKIQLGRNYYFFFLVVGYRVILSSLTNVGNWGTEVPTRWEANSIWQRVNDWDNAQTLCASFPALNSRLSETFLLRTLREETWDARDGEYGTPRL